MVSQGLFILTSLQVLYFELTRTNVSKSTASNTREMIVPATVNFSQLSCCVPLMVMHPTPLWLSWIMGWRLQFPSSTTAPLGWKMGEHQDTGGGRREFRPETAALRPWIWRARMMRKRRKARMRIAKDVFLLPLVSLMGDCEG